jgi:O-methyltransferase
MSHALPARVVTPESHYLDLLKKCLTRYMFPEKYRLYQPGLLPRGRLKQAFLRLMQQWLNSRQLTLVRVVAFDPEARVEGRDWPLEAETMIGLRRLDNLERCITDVLKRGVPGDLIETGVWRGGATIFMRAVLKEFGDSERIVWVADSFKGLPQPDSVQYPADAEDRHWTYRELAVPLEEVRANFARYGLLDDQVCFLVGWFRDTLPRAPIERLAVLRLDGDMYGSTMDALQNLYPKLSIGGYAIIDDYGAVPGCKAAADDFRREQGITEELEWIDWGGVFWKKLRPSDNENDAGALQRLSDSWPTI